GRHPALRFGEHDADEVGACLRGFEGGFGIANPADLHECHARTASSPILERAALRMPLSAAARQSPSGRAVSMVMRSQSGWYMPGLIGPRSRSSGFEASRS